ncbi:hypothetical protein SAZ10_13995 [Mesorhizobium sp. BAC0120]|uniref:hypothetical protein n=1 Tax=Mesorhizobium sp. BAC0120 TaxID=3090670 RepID=UPI00298D4BD0|nr:hypothetical protein [Mesorhizobium sp. BAC0120]MDW6022872.1 hypothetical protein [Mesorhizobium sp. BAC0120]
MKARRDDLLGGDGPRAAIRRFPGHLQLIRELLADDENFRGICDDLAAAEQALAAVDQLPKAVQAERRSEYEELIEDLAKEIRTSFRLARIIPIKRPPKR